MSDVRIEESTLAAVTGLLEQVGGQVPQVAPPDAGGCGSDTVAGHVETLVGWAHDETGDIRAGTQQSLTGLGVVDTVFADTDRVLACVGPVHAF